MKLSKPQQGVAIGMAIGLVISLLALSGAAALMPFPPPAQDVPLGRLQVLGASLLLPAMTLAFAIARLAAHRFWTLQDLDGSGLTRGTERAKLLQALIQNTLEQVALAVPAYAAWSMLAPVRLLAAVPAAAVLFVVGRALFFRGYARGAPGRAIGFSLTFYPTVLLIAGAVIRVAVRLGS